MKGARLLIDLWMVRHGETDWNVEQRVQGWTDVPLNQDGRMQAERLGRCLEGLLFHVILVSDLQRARSTGEIIQSHSPAPMDTCPMLRERCFGTAEGLSRVEMERLFPAGAPDAEREDDVQVRAKTFLGQLIRDWPDSRVLCVSHGGFIRNLLRAIGVSEIPVIGNTSVTRLQWDGTQWRVLALNRTEHLDDEQAV